MGNRKVSEVVLTLNFDQDVGASQNLDIETAAILVKTLMMSRLKPPVQFALAVPLTEPQRLNFAFVYHIRQSGSRLGQMFLI